MHSVRRVRHSAEQQEARRRKEASLIKSYTALENKVLQSRHGGATLNMTTDLLNANPELYTVWNMRRELLGRGKDELNGELRFVEKLIQRYPKVYWLWDHRLWVLDNLGSEAPWQRELGLVSMLLEHDARNFHGWTYRRAVIARMEACLNKSFTQQEMDFTTKKINENFSNFSAWHNRSTLIRKLEIPPSLEEELAYSQEAILMDPEDQSAWIYYRWLLSGDLFKPSITTLQKEKTAITELHEEEPTIEGAYTLYQIHRMLKETPPRSLLESMIKLDPMREKRYTYLMSQVHS